MTLNEQKTIIVFGATGRVGGAAARHLHQNGWHVRAVSRNPHSDAAQALQLQGIDVVQGDMENPDSLRHLFQDTYGVFLVVNGWEGGFEAEVRQGKNVADLAAKSGVAHLVFAAAGTGKRGTDLAHFESKLDIEDYLNARGIPLTTILPPPFMEMMTDPDLYPQAAMWNAKMKVLGKDFKLPWIATDDIGGLAGVIFARPDEFIGRRIKPVGDWKTIAECRQMYQEIAGKKPSRWPLPVWILRKMQPELIEMWEWMREIGDVEKMDLEPIASIYSHSTDVRTFLQSKLNDV